MFIVSSKALKKYKIFLNYKTLLSLLVLFFILVVIFDNKTYIQASQNAVLLWANNVLPSLYIFFVFSKLLTELDFFNYLSNFLNPLIKKIFNVSSPIGHLFFLSILSGYPVGAMLLKDAYQNNQILYTDLHRAITFTSLTGPAFIIGTVGSLMLKNNTAGMIIYLAHLSSAILNGLLFRNYIPKQEFEIKQTSKTKSNKNVLADSVTSALNSILIVGAYIVFFYVILEILSNTGISNIFTAIFKKFFNIDALPIFNGLIEVTRGISEISTLFPVKIATIISSFLISFSGICLHLQSFHYFKECNVKYSFFILQKLTHALLSTLITIPFTFLLWINKKNLNILRVCLKKFY